MMRRTGPAGSLTRILLLTVISLSGCAGTRQTSRLIFRPETATDRATFATPKSLVAQDDETTNRPTRSTSEGMASDSSSSDGDAGDDDDESILRTTAAAIESDPTTAEEDMGQPLVLYPLTMDDILFLADAQNPQIAVARERIQEAYARVDRAETLWLPSLRAGLNYNHHEGTIQDVAGRVFETNRSSFYGGLGANAVGASSPAAPGLVAQFHLTDAVFQPKIASHQAASREFHAAAARNDVLRDAAVAYLELVRAEQGVSIAQEALSNTDKLSELTRLYADTGQGLPSDFQRMEAELALRQDQLVAQQESVQVASARLAQLLHSDPSVLITTGDPVATPLEVLAIDGTAASYVALGLTRRPELHEQKHLVCEAAERLRREKYAPLMPSVLLGMSYGGMGGGLGNSIVNTGDRWDADAIAFWEIRNLGLGEHAARDETASAARQAQLREVALLDQVAREVAQAYAQVVQRQPRIELAKKGIAAAETSYSLNLQRIENVQGLPIEVLQSIQALAVARRAYLDAVIDYNTAQFELCRATGWFLDE